MGEFPYFTNDLTINKSVTEHFHHVVLQSRQSIDKQKADSFLRNVLHAVELAVRYAPNAGSTPSSNRTEL